MIDNRVLPSFDCIQEWSKAGDKIALWVGRAKLPHVGHIAFLKTLWEKGNKLVIANGSCYTINSNNPIQVFQVQAMLALSLQLEGIPKKDFVFVPIPDFHDDDKWRAFISGMPHFNLITGIASDNPRVMEALGEGITSKLECFSRDIITEAIDISATRLRAAIRDNDIAVWEEFAAAGTKMFIAQSGDFYGITDAVLGRETDFELGRQCVDLLMFVNDGFRWHVVLGNRRGDSSRDFAGFLATPGGAIEDYESPINAALFEAEEETGIPLRVSEPHILPTQIIIGKNTLSHLHFVGKFGSPNQDMAGTQGGSSLVFMTIYEGSVDSLEYHLRSDSDLENVRLIPVEEALKTQLAFQQSKMLARAFKLLEKIKGR
ncbi:NUDIX domain-containing protein [Candidatus Parcubacteria bacterium]|jgi:8-oxo-dGTP pyrophosphatase MutT (NUDIX family)/nicotinamide mononucleotide adenylyltransferase|nr:NUDIX domain-containing protein [Candidatus Parcubacteria bacterium]